MQKILSHRQCCFSDIFDTNIHEPLSMGTKRSPEVTMYNAKDPQSSTMLFSDIFDTNRHEPLSMGTKRSPEVTMYNAKDPQSSTMLFSDIFDTNRHEPLSMVTKRSPEGMMYNAKDQQPSEMQLNDIFDTNRHEPLSMVTKRSPEGMMYNAKDQQPSEMQLNDIFDTNRHEPLSMFTVTPDTNRHEPLSMVTKRSPEVMMYNAKDEQTSTMQFNDILDTNRHEPLSMVTKRSPEVMMYNVKDPQLSAMLFNDKFDTNRHEPLSMVTKRSLEGMIYNANDQHPSTMQFNDIFDTNRHEPLSMVTKRSPERMMYNAKDQQVSTMQFNDIFDTNRHEPLSMVTKRTPELMMYNVKDPQPSAMLYNDILYENRHGPMPMVTKRTPEVMVYNVKHQEPSKLLFSEILETDKYEPLSMVTKRSPEGMIYNAEIDDKNPTHIMICAESNVSAFITVNKELTNGTNKEIQILNKEFKNSNTNQWFKMADTFVKEAPLEENMYFSKWKQTISIFGHDDLTRQYFKLKYPALGKEAVIREISKSNVFEKLFWPFSYDIGFMNQKLGLLGFSGLVATPEKQKLMFYEILEKFQTLKIPVQRNKMVYSFNDSLVIDALNRSGLQEMSKEYVDAGLHVYTLEEQAYILEKIEAAMSLINDTMPELHKVINQVVAGIAFYKAEHPGYAGGSVSSALGLIWQDPKSYKEQTVAHYAEQIVHEFIHTSLFLADLVHGTFTDYRLLSMAKVYSPIRHELRDFDKTFHASYVSTGLVLFHARAGNWEKAVKLAEPLRASVEGLTMLDNEVGVLNDSGRAMLQAMEDFLILIRLM
ncbi:uncharacterized protein LOC132746778 [Ruditapes philippinarum]|uniref:uncharacterized protein LOC132746778 n=1 Tax=Ruditapes philippinarum TaxID=129788 RepID=UPI00295B42FE|nr:uncharacterized protein LOC132746778 [Ruditapes philippinarum]